MPDVPDPSFWVRPPDAPYGAGPRDPIRPPLERSWTDALGDRLRAWRGDVRVGAVALLLVAGAAGFVWYRLGSSSGVDGTAARDAARPASTSVAGTTSTTAMPSRVVVHVAGAVVEPGVVELDADARVIDALEAVGGALPDADIDRLNLAARLVDGQRVLVQRVGDPPALADPTNPAASDPSAAGDVTGTPTPAAPINLNSATLEQLEELPGIGPVLAQAIIDERTRRGGFDSVNELLDVSGIGDARFADIQALVTV
jgi:competence protein ComEA